MQWKALLYGLIITLLYIPMVFLGATTVFPDNGSSYYQPSIDCYQKTGPYPADPSTEADRTAWQNASDACQAQVEADRQTWQTAHDSLLAKRYILVTVTNLLVLGIAAFVPLLATPVAMGLFAGSTLATFISTLTYFDSANAIGFGLLVVVFFVVVFFISRASQHKAKKSRR